MRFFLLIFLLLVYGTNAEHYFTFTSPTSKYISNHRNKKLRKGGSSSCLGCAKGKYTDASGGCTDCASGRFQDGCGYSSCKYCGRGKYQKEEGQQSCTDGCYPIDVDFDAAVYGRQTKDDSGHMFGVGATRCAVLDHGDRCLYNAVGATMDIGIYGLTTDYFCSKGCNNGQEFVYSETGSGNDKRKTYTCTDCPVGKYSDFNWDTGGGSSCTKCFSTNAAPTAACGTECGSCGGCTQRTWENRQTTCKSCTAGFTTSGTKKTASSHCIPCPSGSDYGVVGEGCKTYKEKYLDVDTKPTVSEIKTRAQNNHWSGLSSTRKKREGFRAMIKWLRSQFTSRKAKMRKDDLILSTAFKTKMGTRADVEVFHPKDGDTECDVNVNQQTDSFDITLTDVDDTGIVCKGNSIKISKLVLTAINDDSNTYTYYCHDGSGWGTGVSITSGGDYSCDGRKFHVN